MGATCDRLVELCEDVKKANEITTDKREAEYKNAIDCLDDFVKRARNRVLHMMFIENDYDAVSKEVGDIVKAYCKMGDEQVVYYSPAMSYELGKLYGIITSAQEYLTIHSVKKKFVRVVGEIDEPYTLDMLKFIQDNPGTEYVNIFEYFGCKYEIDRITATIGRLVTGGFIQLNIVGKIVEIFVTNDYEKATCKGISNA